ncbi:MAG TPA: hypothetical protein VMT88_13250 [Actinomycetes bacterium]|nr:hypothetical protein [Actinomycetes bacterium]
MLLARIEGIRRLCWWMVVALTGTCLLLTLVVKRQYVGDDLLPLAWICYAPVGAVVAWRRPENPIGWVFLAVGFGASLLMLSAVGMQYALAAGPPVSAWGMLSAWVGTGVGFPLIILSTTFTFLLYPSGLMSPRWRPVLWLAGVLIPLSILFSAISPTLSIGDPINADSFEFTNPIAVHFPANLDNSFWVFMTLLFACSLLSVGSALLRTWRSRGVERLQMRLFAFAVLLLLVVLLPAQKLAEHGHSLMRFVVLTVAFACIPLACGLAILRYHLYDIDRIIGRTTSYALVTGVLLVVYVSVVTAVTQLVPGSSDLAVAAATLSAAVVFRPVLGWAQRLVNRRFNREQYDAERAVEQFAHQLRHQMESIDVGNDLLRVLDETVQPAEAGLWLWESAS